MVVSIKNLVKDYDVVAKTALFGLHKEFKKFRALKGISFEIEEGEFLGLIGPNGSGKTTLMKILAGILVPSEGEVVSLGRVPWKREKEYLKSIGVLFGNRSNLIFDLPVRDSLELYREVYGISKDAYEERLEFLSELLGLEDIIDKPVRKLSFGQRMRAEMASVFLHKPKLVLLDEPTIGMDVLVKERVYAFLKEINRRDKVTILFTTHIMSDIEELCERVVVLHEGSIIWDGKTAELKKRFVKSKVVRFEFSDASKPSKKFLEHYTPKITGNVAQLKVRSGEEVKAIEEIMKNYDVIEMSIEEPNLEDIIREIYAK